MTPDVEVIEENYLGARTFFENAKHQVIERELGELVDVTVMKRGNPRKNRTGYTLGGYGA